MSVWRFTIEGLKAQGQSLSVERLEVQNVAAETPEPWRNEPPNPEEADSPDSPGAYDGDGPTDSEGAEG